MKYMGGKYFLAKDIVNTIQQYVNPSMVDGYLEPFCGALSVLQKINQLGYDCIASDYHPDLIQLWKEIRDDTFIPPTEITEDIYHTIKTYDSPNALKAFVGFGCSFGGKFFAGYADKYKNGKHENYLQEITNSMKKKKGKLDNVLFKCCSYDTWKPHNQLIYCDPPYQTTKFPIKYRTDISKYDDFDNETFWNVMREWSKDNYVFISETTAPDDFVKVWSKSTHRSASQSDKTRYKSESESFVIESLFIHESLKLRI